MQTQKRNGGRDIKGEEQTEGTINKINQQGKGLREGGRQENCEGKRLDHWDETMAERGKKGREKKL